MTNIARRFSSIWVQAASAILLLALGFFPVLALPGSAQGQTFTVLYTFTSAADGEQPDASLILDAAGNLYGTTQYGGTNGGFGTVFKLNAAGKETVLLSFAGTPDAEDPYSGLNRDKAGNLYGTTLYGGAQGGFGTVFKLSPGGKKTVLHSFAGTPDGVGASDTDMRLSCSIVRWICSSVCQISGSTCAPSICTSSSRSSTASGSASSTSSMRSTPSRNSFVALGLFISSYDPIPGLGPGAAKVPHTALPGHLNGIKGGEASKYGGASIPTPRLSNPLTIPS